jgi:hypothetical protein
VVQVVEYQLGKYEALYSTSSTKTERERERGREMETEKLHGRHREIAGIGTDSWQRRAAQSLGICLCYRKTKGQEAGGYQGTAQAT